MIKKNECNCKAIISEEDSRYKIWMKVFGSNEFPLKHPVHHYDKAKNRFLEGNLNKIAPEQLKMLYSELARKFKVKKALIKADFEKRGFIPIKDENIMIEWCEFHVRMVT